MSLRTWGWHDRNAAAVKNLIQQAVTQALAQDKAMSERAALRNVEVSKASARALEKVKASAVKVAAERDAAEQRALAEHNRYKELRRKKVQAYLDSQIRVEAERQAMKERVFALLQLEMPEPKPSKLARRRARVHAAAEEVRQRSLHGWRVADRNRAETERWMAEIDEEDEIEAGWMAHLAGRAARVREEVAQRARATHAAIARRASEANRQADERAVQWFQHADEEAARKEERLASLLSLSEAAENREAVLEERSEDLAERMWDAADAAEERRAEVDAEERRLRQLALKELQVEKTKLQARAEAANKRPPDDSYCAVDEYLARLHAKGRRSTFNQFAREDRQRVQKVIEMAKPPPPPEEAPKAPTRWIPAKNTALLGLKMHHEEQALRKNEDAFMMHRKQGIGSRT